NLRSEVDRGFGVGWERRRVEVERPKLRLDLPKEGLRGSVLIRGRREVDSERRRHRSTTHASLSGVTQSLSRARSSWNDSRGFPKRIALNSARRSAFASSAESSAAIPQATRLVINSFSCRLLICLGWRHTSPSRSSSGATR